MIAWIKRNKITVILLLVIVFMLWNRYRYYLPVSQYDMGYGGDSAAYDTVSMGAPAMESGLTKSIAPSPDYYEPVSDSVNRLVIQNSSMSLLVSDVRDAGNKIVAFAQSKGGFMVNASYNRPDESAYGNVTVRIPTVELDTALEHFRGLAVKVTNENVYGTDVTEQYVNLEERLSTLEKTKVKFEDILNSATEVQDILQVQQQLIYIQEQIDSYIGQKDALEKNAALTRIDVYLSTDELSLPYTPDNKFRPGVIFKLAVRSLVSSLQNFGAFTIWAAVYSIIGIPVLVAFLFVMNLMKKKNKLPN